MATMSTTKTLLTLDGAAAVNETVAANFMSINVSTLRRIRERGEIKSVIVSGNARRYLVSDLAAYLERL